MNIKALGEKVIIEIIDLNKEDGEWSNSGLIWLPNVEGQRNFMGKVIAIGKEVKEDIKVNDVVVFSKYQEANKNKAYNDIKNGRKFIVLDQDEIMAVIEE